MLSLATVILANSLMNGAIPLKYKHRDYKLEQAEIFLRDSEIYDLSSLPAGVIAKESWGYQKEDLRSESQKLIDLLYIEQIRQMPINNFDFSKSGLSANEAGTMYGKWMGKAVYETQYTLKVLDVIAVYGLPASILHKQN
ncbi:hypothetical protein [Shewanella sp. Isolate7]|uniref:hypothetical protein n=1 Tax=Shewanella sp. Isolate7 TaxID=2908528 RepID=UPI001EFD2CFD|nr:hypothetical protein [Shewanella sp. Isolate7]MCG9723352.1 hypothetical protein [Shewanella sp. Isolate7]